MHIPTASMLQVVAQLGGITVIATSVSTWLSNIWAKKLLEKDRQKYRSELEGLKSAYELANTRLQAELDKRIHIHRVQFETEFKALSDIWAKVTALRGTMATLRPQFDIIREGETTEQRLQQRLTPFRNALYEFKQAMFSTSPFYPRNIYDELLNTLLPAATLEETELLTTPPQMMAGRDWAEDAKRNMSQVMKSAERVSEMIREHIAKLSVYEG